jgi:VWFA-related protein
MHRSGFLAVAAASLCAAALTAQQAPPQKPADQPTFRSRVTMVPIDVRVVDSSGNPITDLKAGDFTILENGRRQQIRHFSSVALTAETREPGATPAFEQVLGPRSDALTPQNRRVFLILIGRGRVVGPVKEVEALVDFVRTRLLPQDLVAVQAYNRATPFTGDHAAVAQLLEHFRVQNGQIESDLEDWFSGLRAIYGAQEIPPQIQARIDGLFGSVPTLAARNTIAGPLTDLEQIDKDIRTTTDQLQRAAELAARPPEMAGLPDNAATNTAERLDMTLDQYAAEQADLRQDSTSLFAGINYLRRLEGEKHLVFITPTGVSLPRLEHNQSLAALASDGRIALSIIFTGGPAMPPRAVDMGPDRALGYRPPPVASPSRVFQQTFAVADLRTMTEITGGQMSAYQYGSQAVDRIDRATRFHYLLGYDSSNATLDGRFRDISIRVNRRGATVLHRRGYFATERLVPMNRREFVTATRIAAAGAYARDIEDIVLDVKTTAVEGRDSARQLVVELQVRAPKMRLAEQDGRRVGSIELALFVADGRQRPIGELRQTIDVRLRPESVERFLTEGTTFTTRVPIDGEAFYLKVIAYDYGSDLVGTATRKLR